MTKFATILAIPFVTASLASARLGETIEQIKERYGEPIEKHDPNRKDTQWTPATEAYVYSKTPFMIVVHFLNGKSCIERYFKMSLPESDDNLRALRKCVELRISHTGKSLTHEEVTVLLDSNAGESSWLDVPRWAFSRSYVGTHEGVRNDRGAAFHIRFDTGRVEFFIVTMEWLKERDFAWRNRQERENERRNEEATKRKKLEQGQMIERLKSDKMKLQGF